MLKLKPLISAKAKENLVTHTKNGYKQLCQNSDNPVDTKKELSKLAGVSHDDRTFYLLKPQNPTNFEASSRVGIMSIMRSIARKQTSINRF